MPKADLNESHYAYSPYTRAPILGPSERCQFSRQHVWEWLVDLPAWRDREGMVPTPPAIKEFMTTGPFRASRSKSKAKKDRLHQKCGLKNAQKRLIQQQRRQDFIRPSIYSMMDSRKNLLPHPSRQKKMKKTLKSWRDYRSRQQLI